MATYDELLKKAEEMGGKEVAQLVDMSTSFKSIGDEEALRRAARRLPGLLAHKERLLQADAFLKAQVEKAREALREAEERLREAPGYFIPTILAELVGMK